MADSIWTAAKNDDFRARRDSNFVVDNSDSSVEYGRFICGIEVWRDGFKFCCACIDQFEDGFNFQSLAMRAHGENVFRRDANDKWLAGRRAAKQELADGSLPVWPIPEELLRRKLTVPSQGRLYFVRYALKMGWTIEQVAQSTGYDRWFVDQLKQLVEFEDVLCAAVIESPVCTPIASIFSIEQTTMQLSL